MGLDTGHVSHLYQRYQTRHGGAPVPYAREPSDALLEKLTGFKVTGRYEAVQLKTCHPKWVLDQIPWVLVDGTHCSAAVRWRRETPKEGGFFAFVAFFTAFGLVAFFAAFFGAMGGSVAPRSLGSMPRTPLGALRGRVVSGST